MFAEKKEWEDISTDFFVKKNDLTKDKNNEYDSEGKNLLKNFIRFRRRRIKSKRNKIRRLHIQINKNLQKTSENLFQINPQRSILL